MSPARRGAGKGGGGQRSLGARDGGGQRSLTVRVKTAKRRKDSSTRWLQRQLNDPYVAEAGRQGYRSRAAFKLAQLDDRFGFLKRGARVVDLGAAPGSWSQLAVERAGADGHVVGIDLEEVEPLAGARFLVGDVRELEAAERQLAALRKLLASFPDEEQLASTISVARTSAEQRDNTAMNLERARDEIKTADARFSKAAEMRGTLDAVTALLATGLERKSVVTEAREALTRGEERSQQAIAEVGGQTMVRRVLDQVLASQAVDVVVVTGHERAQIEAALQDMVQDIAGEGRCRLVHNPDFAAGLSTSLHRGLAALSEDIDGALVCLGDMPAVTAGVIDRLIAAFDPLEGRAICLPTWAGKRGNPALLARRYFAEVQAISGDVGARALIGEYPEAVAEVAMDDLASGFGVLEDVDTPEDLGALSSGDAREPRER